MKAKEMLLFLVLGVISCTGFVKNYGLINPSPTVTKDFENFHVDPQLQYYISGSDLHPNAVIGLRRDVAVDPRTLWKKIDMTPGKMEELLWYMKARISQLGISLYLYGFELLTPDGKSIGVWYSIPTARTMLRVNEDKTVWIETPDLETYEKLEPREKDS